MELFLVLSGFVGLVVAGGIALVYLWTSRRAATPAAKPVERVATPPKPAAAPTTPRPVPQDDVDDVTIITFQPMLLQEAPKPRPAGPPDMVHTIVADPGAGDDEPSAAHALILLSAVAQSHRGRRRKNNEDSFLVSERHHLFIVADGMGGYAGGEIASALATETILSTYDDDAFDGPPEGDLPLAAGHLVTAIRKANLAIFERAQADPELQGMGTTLVSIRFSPRKERMYIGHVGDSRVYRYRKGALEQLTTDHTLAAMGVEGPQAHSLTRAVGVGPTLEVDLLLAEPEAGDTYLLCSDGLTKMCPHETIEAVIAASEDAQVAVQALIDNANARGGKDNVTVIVVQVRDVAAMPVLEDPEAPVAVV